MADDEARLAAVGPRMRDLRRRAGLTLAHVSEATGISVSTLSRLESGGRRPNLELLLPVARALDVTLDDLLSPPPPARAPVRARPRHRRGETIVPLTRRAGGLQAFKMVLAPNGACEEPSPRTHEGYEWIYVLNGRLRVVLGDLDFVAVPGEALEFDTRVPHWFGRDGDQPVEFLSIFGPQGERMHLRARPKRRLTAGSS